MILWRLLHSPQQVESPEAVSRDTLIVMLLLAVKGEELDPITRVVKTLQVMDSSGHRNSCMVQ